MSDDLIKQWDEYVESMGSVMGEVEHMAQQMRDRIEQLERENAKLVSEVNIAKYGEPNFAWSIHNAIMADLQANLAKAVEALQAAKVYIDDLEMHEGAEGFSVSTAEAAAVYHKALAELEGQ